MVSVARVCYTRAVSAVRPRRLVPALLVVAAVLTCNAPRLSLLDNAVTKGVVDTVSSGPRTRIDVLWVIDNSGSMCQEQANLIGSFRTFVTGLAELEADVQMAVVTTDMTDPGQQGKFQHHPATDFRSCTLSDPEKGVYYCLSDEDCGEGGCLCGLPHLLRCESDGDCPESLSCVTSGRGSQVRFCSAPCGQHSDCQTVLTEERTEAFWCAEPGEGGEAGAGKYCLLRVCEDDTFCPPSPATAACPARCPGTGGSPTAASS